MAAPLGVLLAAPPALADTPAAWEDPEPMSTLAALLIFVGLPLALFVVISVLAYAPTLIHGSRAQRGATSWTDPAWFGDEVGGTERPRPDIESSEKPVGGASARW